MRTPACAEALTFSLDRGLLLFLNHLAVLN